MGYALAHRWLLASDEVLKRSAMNGVGRDINVVTLRQLLRITVAGGLPRSASIKDDVPSSATMITF